MAVDTGVKKKVATSRSTLSMNSQSNDSLAGCKKTKKWHSFLAGKLAWWGKFCLSLIGAWGRRAILPNVSTTPDRVPYYE